VKALVARSVWGDEAFYRIYKGNDAIFTEALKLFDKAEELAFAQ
jgi:carboxyl-terminal processing protease